jgi:hypothetical protein
MEKCGPIGQGKLRNCRKEASVIGDWGQLPGYVLFTRACGSEDYNPPPLRFAEEGNSPNLLEEQGGK